MNLIGKRLLYLGGIPRARYVVERAKNLGLYVIVADYTKTNPAKEEADESALIDALDVDSLEVFCREKKIDGIISGYVDIILPVWRELCKRLGLPCYIEKSMLMASTDKCFFKNLCDKYSVPIPNTYSIEMEESDIMIQSIPFPVFIKPLDASGSRGADVSFSIADFREKYENARSWSKKGLVTVEDYLQGTEFILDYFIIDGKPYLASMADRYTIEGHAAAVNCCNLMIFPSKHLDRYYKEVDPFVCNMFVKEGYRDGVVFLQGYVGNTIKFYEMGCRLGGSWPYIDEYYHHINPMDMLFCHAITGKMLINEKGDSITARFNGRAAVIYFLAAKDDGVIKTVNGVDEVKRMPYVVSVLEYYKAGDHFSKGTQTDVLLLAVHLVANDFLQLRDRVNVVYSLIDFLNENGESILTPQYDINKLIQEYEN